MTTFCQPVDIQPVMVHLLKADNYTLSWVLRKEDKKKNTDIELENDTVFIF